MRDMLSLAIKDNTQYVKKAVMTGILRCPKDDLFPGMNNVSLNCVVDRQFSEYYGFTESEVYKILKASVWNTIEVLGLNRKRMASWYDGYNIGGLKIYNPWSIMNCLYRAQDGENNIYKDYWIDTGSDHELNKAMRINILITKILV
ncbi:unnamed protein product [Blepharisma stoltei]|uniref:AAA-ATPase-like domain-containing protein n=1 Tax=Blepharisma stoltei TaxID=1481888 RepID=A0AAU9KJK8_9CILI|nr:unnamed protein product [Blepharisma stoltei]